MSIATVTISTVEYEALKALRLRERTLVACAGCGNGIIPRYKLCQDCLVKEVARLEKIIELYEEQHIDE